MEQKIILKYAMLIAIIIAIIMQIRVTKMIMDKEELFNSSPLPYGAKLLGIEYCTCYVESETKIREVWFNQTSVIIKTKGKPGEGYTIKLNLSEFSV